MAGVVLLTAGCAVPIADQGDRRLPAPVPSSGPIGPPAFDLTLPGGWVDTTAAQQARNPTIVASAVNRAGDTFSLQLMTSAWARLEDVPADLRGRFASLILEEAAGLARSDGFDHVELVRQGEGTVNGLRAIVVDLEAKRGGTSARFRQWTTWHQGVVIMANVLVGAERWTQTAPVFDRIVADLRLPAERLRPTARDLGVSPPSGWTDFTAQQRAQNLSTILALRSPAAGMFMVTVAESPYARLEDIPSPQRQAFLSGVTATVLNDLRQGGYEAGRVTAQGTGELMGRPALTMEFAATKGPQTLRLRWVGTWHRHRIVVVVMAAPTDRWDANAPGFDALLADPQLQGALGPAPLAPAAGATSSSPMVTADGRTLYANSWAVVIGIDRYQKHGLRLRYAVNDARSVRDLLLRLGFPPENIFLLVDGQATKQSIQDVLAEELRVRTGLEDRVVVFFAGHGLTAERPGGGDMGYLLPVDGDPDRLHSTAISMADVREMASLIPAKHMFFAIDACYSGLIAQRSATAPSPGPGDPSALVRGRLREILTAGERDQPVVEEAGHGLFTRRLIEGLSGEADFAPRDGMITGTELAYWLVPRVQAISGNRQTPFFGKMDGLGDFVFVVPPRR